MGTMTKRSIQLAVVALAFGFASTAAAQDALIVGGSSCINVPRGATSVTVPVYIKDFAATALGMDQPPANRIQAFSFKLAPSPASAIALDGSGNMLITATRAGITASKTPGFEQNPRTPTSGSYVVQFDGGTNPLGFTQPPTAIGDLVANVTIGLNAAPAAGVTINLNVLPDAAVTQYSNSGGTVSETVQNGGLVITSGCLTIPAAAGSLPQRTFVASTGLDTNNCLRATPCRNLTAAIIAVAPGGEVVALDSAGFGQATINKSLSIISPAGVYGAVTGLTNTAITVNAPGANVAIRGFFINGLGGMNAISFTNGNALHLENMVVSGFPSGSAVVASVDGARLTIRDSQFRLNGVGIAAASSTTPLEASIDRTRIDRHANAGVTLNGTVKVSIRESALFANNTGVAVLDGTLTLESCMISGGTLGIDTSPGAVARLSGTSILNTTMAMQNAGGTLVSFGDNRLAGNGADGTFDTSVSPK